MKKLEVLSKRTIDIASNLRKKIGRNTSENTPVMTKLWLSKQRNKNERK